MLIRINGDSERIVKFFVLGATMICSLIGVVEDDGGMNEICDNDLVTWLKTFRNASMATNGFEFSVIVPFILNYEKGYTWVVPTVSLYNYC